tara:strand:- start:2356 stop:4101 length:1746 start_codon:yes stop_codon:yes gene_type:complete
MKHFRIPSFTGIQAHRDDADRGALRIAEGCVPAGPGGLRSAPVFTDVGDVTSFSPDSNNYLTGSDDVDNNSVMFSSRDGEVKDIRVFPQSNTKLGALGATYDVAVPGGGATLYPDRVAYMSSVGNNTVAWGDGSAEAVFTGLGGRVVAPDEIIYHLEYARFPNCRYFVVGPRKTLYAAGNPAAPLTVYVSEPADMVATHRDALYSDKTFSTVQILMADGHEITALSGGRDHVVVHTDGGAHLLKAPAPNQASTGYRVEQAPLTAASASVNHQVVAGELGSFPFWLGFDGQIYKDESGTRGPDAKDAYADPDQVSWMAKGRWDKEMPVDLSDSFATYNSELGYYIVYVKNTEYEAWVAAGSPADWSPPSKYKGYIYSELAKSLSGPFVHNNVTAITSIKNTSEILAVDRDMNILHADLDHFRDYDFAASGDPWPDTSTQPAGQYIAATEDGAFLYRGKYLTSPFAEPQTGTTALVDPMYFENANLAIMETAWMPLGDENSDKQIHSITLNFSNNSVGRVWAYVESDDGLVSGQYKGTITPKMKVFTNIRGVRFRVRMFVASSESHPWNLREMVIGYLQGEAV